ncbi:PAS domain-containing protein [Hydrogenophaga crassostreae]|uniref:PAS domain-containing protein n=1 Tax=Hydrogenophaga crassostreae TaxID=1763535 RepID=UPI0018D3EDC1|nr:PAS domain-containing protein [Hydrogenophaga crassostreae]
MIASTTAFLWRDRQQALQDSGEHATRQAERLSQDIEQTLKVVRTAIAQFDEQLQNASTSPFQALPFFPAETNATLLASLPLPFELHALAAEGVNLPLVGLENAGTRGRRTHVHANGPPPPGTWTLGDVGDLAAQQIIPLTWAAKPNLHQVTGYGIDLSFAAVQAWLERDRKVASDRVSLFWLNGDGSATLLARSPMAPKQLGQRVTADWVAMAMQQPSGVLDLVSQLDQRPRRVAYSRLQGAAGSLVVVYGADTQATLAKWHAQLPYFVLFALFLASAIAYGAWRLDATLRALTQSKRHFQLMLDSGNVWDWDIAKKALRYSPLYISGLGYGSVPPERMASTLFQAVHPDDIGRLKAALMAHLNERTPYALTFRIRDGHGQYRWFETKGQAFWDHNGLPQYMAGTTFEVSERIALEETQRQTLQRLDMVANASPVLFWTSDLDGKVNWVNRRWLAFTGRTIDEELGHGWLDNIHPDDLHRRNAFFESVKVSQEALSTEYRLRDKDGVFRWVVVQCLPFRDADQNVTGFIGSCVDVSELKEAEHAARQRGAMLEAVFNVLQDMLFVVDQDGRFIHFQGASNESLYLPPEAFLGKLVREVMPATIAQVLHEQLKLAERGQLQEFDYVLQLPDGEGHFDARMARLPDSDHYMVVARNITEREQLRHQRERLRQFMTLQARLATRFINLPVVDLDRNIGLALGEIGAFVQADRAYIFAYDMKAHTATNTHEWCGEGIEPAIDQLKDLSLDLFPNWVDAHLRQENFEVDDVPGLPDGPLRDILEPQGIHSLIALPMSSSTELLGFVGFDAVHTTHVYTPEEVALLKLFAEMLVNVLGRQQSEARLHQLTTELESRVVERTQQLDTSVKRLSQANRELESFAYSVSHDLKSPVRSVEGFAALLLEDHGKQLDDEVRDYLQRIQRSAHHMARLINDLLAYARIEQMDTQLAAVPLAPTISEVLDALRNDIEASGGKVEVHIPESLAVKAHPQGLSMVLRNLIDNALKFARPGVPPEVAIEASALGGKVHLSVRDRGQGFDMKYHDRIFAIFQRLHRPDEVSGTGIGLAMVHKAVERMNGRIWAESTPGEGAEFHIELPSA